MTLNRNPADNFVEIEQAAFEPSNFVPGIGASPDKMLLGRLFSYADAHRYRIGDELRAAAAQRARRAGELLRQGGRDAHRRTARPGVRAELLRRPAGRPVATGRRAWVADGAMVRAPTRSTPKTTTSASPARWCARCSTTPRASGWSATSAATCSTA